MSQEREVFRFHRDNDRRFIRGRNNGTEAWVEGKEEVKCICHLQEGQVRVLDIQQALLGHLEQSFFLSSVMEKQIMCPHCQ